MDFPVAYLSNWKPSCARFFAYCFLFAIMTHFVPGMSVAIKGWLFVLRVASISKIEPPKQKLRL